MQIKNICFVFSLCAFVPTSFVRGYFFKYFSLFTRKSSLEIIVSREKLFSSETIHNSHKSKDDVEQTKQNRTPTDIYDKTNYEVVSFHVERLAISGKRYIAEKNGTAHITSNRISRKSSVLRNSCQSFMYVILPFFFAPFAVCFCCCCIGNIHTRRRLHCGPEGTTLAMG